MMCPGMQTEPRFDVLGLGCVAVDDLVFVPRHPASDSKMQVLRRERHCGGLTATALVAAARLGCRAAYAGALGDDPDSRFVREALAAEGVETQHIVSRPTIRPVRSVILVEKRTGARTILYDVAGAPGADSQRPTRALIESSRVLLVDRWGMPGMIRAARIARRAGIPVVGDLETFELPGFEELLGLADHLIVSENFARRYTGARRASQGVRRLWRPDRAVVVVTCGADGCWWRDRIEAKPRHHPAFQVAAVDTTGCGDVFHGAYAAALAKGLSLRERLRVASGAAALKATRAGGQTGSPTWRALQAFLAKLSTI
jgi:sugar/nucleoside kinase (ribokinase family)